MPQLIAAVVVGAVGATGLAATAITAVVSLASAYALSAILAPKAGKPSDGQVIKRESVGSRKRHYGIVHTAGQLSFHESRGGTLGYVVTLGHGRTAEILEHRLNNKPVTLGAGGVVSDAKFRGAIRILTRDGADDQTAISELTSSFSEWTADHRQRGCALAALIGAPVKQKHFQEVYEGREPEYSQVRKFGFVYDPRKDSTQPGGSGPHRQTDSSTWEWSDNAPLVIGDFMAHPDGFGLGMSRINWANIAAEADIADQLVPVKGGGTIKRWRLWGSYDLAENERRTVLADMLKACDGFVFDDAQGKFNLHVGRWQAPSVHISDLEGHVIAIDAWRGVAGPEAADEIKSIYTDASADYGEQEAATYPPSASDDHRVDRHDVYWCPHHNQAVRLGKRHWTKLGDRWRVTLTCTLFGLNALGQRNIMLTLDELAINEVAFSVDRLAFDPVSNRVELTLTEVRESDWAFDPEGEEGDAPNADSSTPSTGVVAAPTGVTLSTIDVAIGATNGVAIKASWSAPAIDSVIWAAEYQPDGETAWTPMVVNQDERSATSGIVTSGIDHDVRIKAISLTGRESAWSSVTTITPTADNSGVSAPSALAVTGGAGQAVISWRNPVEAAFAYARVYRHTSAVFGSAVQAGSDQTGGLGQVMSLTDTGLSAGTYYFWVRAFNAAGDPSAVAGPVSATVS